MWFVTSSHVTSPMPGYSWACSSSVITVPCYVGCVYSRKRSVTVWRPSVCPVIVISPSSDQFLNIVRLFGTMAFQSIEQTRSRQFRDRLPLRIVYPITTSMPYWAACFRLFLTGAISSAAISFRKCMSWLYSLFVTTPA